MVCFLCFFFFGYIFSISDLINSTSSEIKDLVFNIVQNPLVKRQNSGEAESKLGSSENEDPDSVSIDFEDFVNILSSNLKDSNPDEDLKRAFRKMDFDSDGSISKKDFRSALEEMGGDQKISDQEIEEILSVVDVDSDKRITFEDFKMISSSN